MGVKIIIDGQTIYHSSFRACRMGRTDANTEGEREARSFHFSGGHTFQGKYHTTKQEEIKGYVWQAGADPDAMLLGVSFEAHNRNLLNTIHIAKPGRRTETLLDRRVEIRTFPLTLAASARR